MTPQEITAVATNAMWESIVGRYPGVAIEEVRWSISPAELRQVAAAVLNALEQFTDHRLIALSDLMRLWDMACHAPVEGDVTQFLQRIDRSLIQGRES